MQSAHYRPPLECLSFVTPDDARPAPDASRASTQRWTVADFQAAYMNGLTTPSQVAENVLKAIAASEAHDPPLRLFAAYDPADLRRQAAESTRRYGNHTDALVGDSAFQSYASCSQPASLASLSTCMAKVSRQTVYQCLIARQGKARPVSVCKTCSRL